MNDNVVKLSQRRHLLSYTLLLMRKTGKISLLFLSFELLKLFFFKISKEESLNDQIDDMANTANLICLMVPLHGELF